MSGVKAKLKIVLQADDTVVAESEDATLWQRVLVVINSGAEATTSSLGEAASRSAVPAANSDAEALKDRDDELGRLAGVLGLTIDVVQGACAPSRKSPYLTLDMHCWDAMKDQTPSRGIGSISPMAVAATLLGLWMQAAKLGNATQAEAQKVLGTINLRDANPTRSISGAEWLSGRTGGVIVINPARAKRAVAVAKAFCSRDWKTDATWKGGAAE